MRRPKADYGKPGRQNDLGQIAQGMVHVLDAA